MKFIVYVAILLATAAGLALGLDLLTRPPAKLEATARQPSAEVRQIPIARAATPENGDSNSKLTPLYPASPGKDLPVQQAPVIAAKPPAAETSGSAPTSSTEVKEKASSTASAAPSTEEKAAGTASTARAAPNSCNAQACSAAYRSFRASDCTYQPFSGERRICDASQGESGQATASRAPAPDAPAHAQAPSDRHERGAQGQKSQEEKDLQEAIRTVRGLPENVERDRGAPPVEVIEPPDGGGYGGGRRWIIERR